MSIYGDELRQHDVLRDLIYQLKSVPAHFPGDTELEEGIKTISEIFKKRIESLVKQANSDRPPRTFHSFDKLSRSQESLRGVDGPDTFWDTSDGRCELVMP